MEWGELLLPLQVQLFAQPVWQPIAPLATYRSNLGWLPRGLRWLMLRHEANLALVASPVDFSIYLGYLPHLETLALCDGWLPQLCLVAPALKLLSIRIYQHMLSNIQSLQRHPTLQTIMMSIETLHSPNHLPLFLPEACMVSNLTTRFCLGEVSSGLPPPSFLPCSFNMTASTHDPTEHCKTDLAPLSACSMLHTLTIIVLGDKLTLCGIHSLAPSLSLIMIRWNPAHLPAHLSHQFAPGWGCRLAGHHTQDMLHLYRIPEGP